MTQKVTVDRDELYAALQKVMKVVPKGKELGKLPAFVGHVHLSMDGDKLAIRGTSIDNTIVVRIAAEGQIEASVLVKTLFALSKPQKGEGSPFVNIESLDGKIAIEADGIVTSVDKTVNPGDHLELPKGKWKSVLPSCDGNEFGTLLKYVLAAASTDETRPHICCVALVDDFMVTTDGHRLHKVKLPKKPKETINLPRIGAVLCSQFIDKDESITIKCKNDGVLIQSGNWELYTKVVNAAFPPYEQVIPRNYYGEIQVDTGQLVKRLNKLRCLSDAVELVLSDEKCVLLTYSSEFGNTETELPLKDGSDYADETLKLGLAIDYLLDAINSDCEEISIRLNGPLDPVVLQVGALREVVIMPRRR